MCSLPRRPTEYCTPHHHTPKYYFRHDRPLARPPPLRRGSSGHTLIKGIRRRPRRPLPGSIMTSSRRELRQRAPREKSHHTIADPSPEPVTRDATDRDSSREPSERTPAPRPRGSVLSSGPSLVTFRVSRLGRRRVRGGVVSHAVTQNRLRREPPAARSLCARRLTGEDETTASSPDCRQMSISSGGRLPSAPACCRRRCRCRCRPCRACSSSSRRRR